MVSTNPRDNQETTVLQCSFVLLLEGGDMLVPVEFKGVSKWVRVPKTDDAYNYSEFLQGGNLSVVIKSN